MFSVILDYAAAFVLGVLSSLTAARMLQRTRIASVFPGVNATPKWYNLKDFAFLKALRRGEHVTVFARTAAEYSRAPDAIRAALGAGATFRISVSSHQAVATMGDPAILQDLDEALAVFSALVEEFPDQFAVNVLSTLVENSLTLVQKKHPGKQCLVLSLSKSKVEDEKLVAVFRKKKWIELVLRRYSDLPATPLPVYLAIRAYEPSVLDIRRNGPQPIMRRLVRVFGTPKGPSLPRVQPHTIQISLTNRCPLGCAMCTHHELGAKEDRPLTGLELGRVFKQLRQMEARSLIISGGEPCLRPPADLVAILESAASSGLAVGLITSGLGQGARAVTDASLLRSIQTKCSWVQLSIDSFQPQVYERIRRGDLATVTQSLAALAARLGDRLEVCLTIQQANIEGLLDGSEYRAFQRLTQALATPVRVRLKFAHGTNDRTRISVEQVNGLFGVDGLREWGLDYFEKVIPALFRPEDISDGLPCRSSMQQHLAAKRCYALYESLYIDANGDLYPCCYLFDDNVGASPYREKYRLGSVYREGVKTIPDDTPTILDTWRRAIGRVDRPMPIEEAACYKCTRYVGFNVFANRLAALHERHRDWFTPARIDPANGEEYWL